MEKISKRKAKKDFIERARSEKESLFSEAVEKAKKGEIDEAIKLATLVAETFCQAPLNEKWNLYIYGFLAQLYLEKNDKENARPYCLTARCIILKHPRSFSQEDKDKIEELSLQAGESEE
jgi:hypothetical protein